METSPAPIPVICDRCREEGMAGDDPFAEIRGLLDFEPVQRRAHVNGWKEEHQRAFIAALALTGSPRQAARALGRHANGAEQLRKGKGGRSFADAWAAALELYREREFFRIKDALTALAEQQEQRDEIVIDNTHLRALPPPQSSPSSLGEGDRSKSGGGAYHDFEEPDFEEADDDPPVSEDLAVALLSQYALKLSQERTARHAGRIAEADFYLRQATFFEVAIELTGPGVMEALKQARAEGHDLLAIADTPATRMLDAVRRKFWEEAGEPERPPVPEHLLIDHGPCRTEPLESGGKASITPPWFDGTREEWTELEINDQFRRYNEQYERDAVAYAHWLARAQADFERRQSAPLPSAGEGGLHSKPGEGANQ